MAFHVRILPRAERDIERNAQWWAEHHSVDQAVRWFYAVHDQLKSLRQLPERQPLSAQDSQFPYEVREKLVGLGPRPGYRAVFTIRGNEVFVLTVRAGEQDHFTPDQIEFDPQ